jgi:hypothetical protein
MGKPWPTAGETMTVHLRGRSAHASGDVPSSKTKLGLPEPVVNTVRWMPVAGRNAIAVKCRGADLKSGCRVGVPVVALAVDGVIVVIDSHWPPHPSEIQDLPLYHLPELHRQLHAKGGGGGAFSSCRCGKSLGQLPPRRRELFPLNPPEKQLPPAADQPAPSSCHATC